MATVKIWDTREVNKESSLRIQLTHVGFIIPKKQGQEIPAWVQMFPQLIKGKEKEYVLTMSVRSFLQPENGIHFAVHLQGNRAKRLCHGTLQPSSESPSDFVKYCEPAAPYPYSITGYMFVVKDHGVKTEYLLGDLLLGLEGDALVLLEDIITKYSNSTDPRRFMNKPVEAKASESEKSKENQDSNPGPSSSKIK